MIGPLVGRFVEDVQGLELVYNWLLQVVWQRRRK